MMADQMNDHEAHCYEMVADCRLRAATDLFAHTWDPVVLAALRPGPLRRRELRAAIGGISDKVLTDTLHRLLASGLINRHAHAEAPPRVEYNLTSLGQSLVDGPMKALGRWTIEHGDELLDAQERAAAAGQPSGLALKPRLSSEPDPQAADLRP